MKSEQRGASLNSISSMNLSGGVQNKTTPALARDNEVLHLLNGNIDIKTGGIVGRCGNVLTKAVGNVVDNLVIFRNGTTRKYIVIASDGSNNVVYTSVNDDFSGTLTSILSGYFSKAVSIKTATFAKKEYFFNGTQAPKSYDGSSFASVTNAPTVGKYPAVYQQRLFVFGTDGFLYYSDTINATGDDFTTTTWTNRGINPNDGQAVKGMYRHRGRLVLFKTESIYRYDGSNEPEPIINVGTHSENAIVQTDTEIYFHHHTEIRKMGLGDPIIISRPVEKFLKGASSNFWAYVSSGKDESNVYFHIGDVTINDVLEWDYGVTYSDVTLVYNFLLERWMIFSGFEVVMFFTNVDNAERFFFDSSGNIYTISPTIYNDNGNPINFEVMWHPISYGVPHLRKMVDRIVIDGRKGMYLEAGSDPFKLDNKGRYNDDGTLQIRSEIHFNKLWIRCGAGYTNTPPLIEQLYIGSAYVGNTV